MDIADQPAPVDIAHDVFDRSESQFTVRLVKHGEEDATDDLDDQDQQRQRTEEIPEIEILRRIVFGQMLLHHLG